MAVGVLNVLGDHVVNGLLSVPHESSGTLNEPLSKKIQLMKGARNNLPDEQSLRNAQSIENFILNDVLNTDILMVLISGGGSALLSSPVKEITLREKIDTIKLIANEGGDIQQLNTMRKNLSRLKGGKLGALSPTKKVISLIISDIVGDPLDLIASGPTVFDRSSAQDCLQILNELEVVEKTPKSVLDYLKTDRCSNITEEILNHCNNFIVGNNVMFLRRVSEMASDIGFKSFVMSSCLEGSAHCVGENLAEAAVCISEGKFKECLGILTEKLKVCENLITEEELKNIPKFCLIFGGETTVKVQGTGKGGRNQHMVLSALNYIRKAVGNNRGIDMTSVTFLSAGTDGQDGPTDATGAFLDNDLITAQEENIDVFLNNCGSYDFFTSSQFNSKYLIKTGLTGMNVMDVQILFIDRTRN